MTDDNNQNEATSYPIGLDFIAIIVNRADNCSSLTDSTLPTMGKLAPKCVEYFGTGLSILNRLGTCWYKCRNSEHRLEYIVGRACANASASFLLLRAGYYDESLTLTRSIGEVANLLQLFNLDGNAYSRWRTLDEQGQRRQFAPVKVRLAIVALGKELAVSEERYRSLSGRAAHIGSETKPQAYNLSGIATLGGYFQEIGVLCSLNELAVSIGTLILSASKLLGIDAGLYGEFRESVIDLLSSVGGTNIISLPDQMQQLSELLKQSDDGNQQTEG